MRVAVIGGTGLVGSRLVDRLRKSGHEAIAVARSTGVDIFTGAGLDAALAGAEVVVDASNPGYIDPAEMMRFFKVASSNLLAAERQANVRHHIVFSAIGAGRINSGYYRAKTSQEALVSASGIPFTIVRSAPLFEYIYDIFDLDRDDAIVRVPPLRVQPIAAEDAAELLLRLALAQPENGVIEVAGPNVFRLPDLAAQILTANEDYRSVLTDGNATFFGAHLTGQALTAGPAGEVAPTGFEDWLRGALVPA